MSTLTIPSLNSCDQLTPAESTEIQRNLLSTKLGMTGTRPAIGKQVRLRVVYIDFWSTMKLFFLLGIGLAVVTMALFLVTFLVLQAVGALTYAHQVLADVSDGQIQLSRDVTLPRVMGFAAIVSIVNLIVVPTLGAVAAGIYNHTAKVGGAPEVGFVSP